MTSTKPTLRGLWIACVAVSTASQAATLDELADAEPFSMSALELKEVARANRRGRDMTLLLERNEATIHPDGRVDEMYHFVFQSHSDDGAQDMEWLQCGESSRFGTWTARVRVIEQTGSDTFYTPPDGVLVGASSLAPRGSIVEETCTWTANEPRGGPNWGWFRYVGRTVDTVEQRLIRAHVPRGFVPYGLVDGSTEHQATKTGMTYTGRWRRPPRKRTYAESLWLDREPEAQFGVGPATWKQVISDFAQHIEPEIDSVRLPGVVSQVRAARTDREKITAAVRGVQALVEPTSAWTEPLVEARVNDAMASETATGLEVAMAVVAVLRQTGFTADVAIATDTHSPAAPAPQPSKLYLPAVRIDHPDFTWVATDSVHPIDEGAQRLSGRWAMVISDSTPDPVQIRWFGGSYLEEVTIDLRNPPFSDVTEHTVSSGWVSHGMRNTYGGGTDEVFQDQMVTYASDHYDATGLVRATRHELTGEAPMVMDIEARHTLGATTVMSGGWARFATDNGLLWLPKFESEATDDWLAHSDSLVPHANALVHPHTVNLSWRVKLPPGVVPDEMPPNVDRTVGPISFTRTWEHTNHGLEPGELRSHLRLDVRPGALNRDQLRTLRDASSSRDGLGDREVILVPLPRQLESLGRFEEAMTTANALVTLHPDDPLIHTYRISLLAYLGQMDAALAAAQDAVRRFPGERETWRALGYVHYRDADGAWGVGPYNAGAVEKTLTTHLTSFSNQGAIEVLGSALLDGDSGLGFPEPDAVERARVLTKAYVDEYDNSPVREVLYRALAAGGRWEALTHASVDDRTPALHLAALVATSQQTAALAFVQVTGQHERSALVSQAADALCEVDRCAEAGRFLSAMALQDPLGADWSTLQADYGSRRRWTTVAKGPSPVATALNGLAAIAGPDSWRTRRSTGLVLPELHSPQSAASRVRAALEPDGEEALGAALSRFAGTGQSFPLPGGVVRVGGSWHQGNEISVFIDQTAVIAGPDAVQTLGVKALERLDSALEEEAMELINAAASYGPKLIQSVVPRIMASRGSDQQKLTWAALAIAYPATDAAPLLAAGMPADVRAAVDEVIVSELERLADREDMAPLLVRLIALGDPGLHARRAMAWVRSVKGDLPGSLYLHAHTPNQAHMTPYKLMTAGGHFAEAAASARESGSWNNQAWALVLDGRADEALDVVQGRDTAEITDAQRHTLAVIDLETGDFDAAQNRFNTHRLRSGLADSSWGYVRGRLAAHYGLDQANAAFEQVRLDPHDNTNVLVDRLHEH